MTLAELKAAVEDAIVSGGPNLPVIIKYEEVPGRDVVYQVAVATKQGHSFRVYADPATRRVIES